jgi:hypothetical protein
LEIDMSHASPLTPQPRASAPAPAVTSRQPTNAPGESVEQFQRLLESQPTEGSSRVATDKAVEGADDRVPVETNNDDEVGRGRRGDAAATAMPVDPRPFAPAQHAASVPASAPDARKEQQTLRDALSIDNGERSAVPGASIREAEAPRTSGTQVRQQQLWAQAQRETAAADKTTTPPQNMQVFDGSTLHVAPTAASPDASAVTAPRADNDFVMLLQNQCAQMYVAQGADPNNARMLLDLGHALPGSLVELARDGAFLRVRLHAADAQAGLLMDAQRERLVAALERSTRLGVVVDVVRAG